MTGEPTSRAPEVREPGGRLAVGGSVGSYVIESLLGRGGMAVVYVARHRELDKKVAIKVLKPELAENEEIRKRFLREGRAAARVHHPHVVDITDVGSDGDDVYLVMELLEGETLSTVLEREVILSPERIVDYLVPVVAALGAAHKRGVVHRDLKPENIFLARDPSGRAFPKVLDFGISHIGDTAADDRVTEMGSVLGTPHYMSPEQARGEFDLDARTDQFSLAIILYEALVGRLPYDGETAVQLIHEVSRGDVRPLRAFKSWIPEDLESVVMRALASKPEDRYATIEDLGLALLPFGSERTAEVWRAALMGQTRSPSLPPGSPGPASTGRRKRAELATTPHRRASQGGTGDAAAPVPRASESLSASQIVAPPVTSTGSTPAASMSPRVAALVGLVAIAVIATLVYSIVLTRTPEVATATLHLSPGAEVTLDGHAVGSGTLVSFTFPSDGAPHHLVAHAEGRTDFEASVTRADQIPTQITLEPLPAEPAHDSVVAHDDVPVEVPATDVPPTDVPPTDVTVGTAPPPTGAASKVRPRPRTGRGDPPPSSGQDDLRIER